MMETSVTLGGETLLAHEWISSIGGSENVYREILSTFPDAAGVCVWNDVPEMFPNRVRELPMADWPIRGKKAMSIPFMLRQWRTVDLAPYDRVIASTHAFAHHLAGRAAQQGKAAYAYVHTPARYVWAPDVEDRGRRPGIRLVSQLLAPYDRLATSNRVNYAANSAYIARRISESWHQDSRVIYPPVDVDRIQAVCDWRDELGDEDLATLERLPRAGFVLGASRLVEYKRLDRVIEVGETMDLPVVIAGSGPDAERLAQIAESARVPVHLVGRVSDALLYALYQAALILVFVAVEDFGIMPVEAMAAGTPAVVGDQGGAAESVLRVGGGAIVPTDEPVSTWLPQLHVAAGLDMTAAMSRVDAFSVEAFRKNIRSWTEEA